MSSRKDEELDDEIQSHLRMATHDRIQSGENSRDAQDAATREFGNVGVVKEVTREMWSGASLETFLQDLRYGLRMLVKSPGFAVAAILTLALGIGANTAVFSVVNGVLLKTLPFPHPEQLVTLAESKPNFDAGSISYPNFRDWQKENHTFSSMAITRRYSFILTGRGDADRVSGDFVSSDFFQILGVKPLLGRTFLPGEDEVGAPPIALLTETLWREKFGADPDMVGKGLTLDGKTYSIVGVIPKSFDLLLPAFHAGFVYLPIGQWSNNLLLNRGAGLGIHGIGRLKPGVTIEQARADMSSVTRNLTALYPDMDTGIGARVMPLKQDMVRNSQLVLWVLLGAVGFVLLIACVNVANLLLARSMSRQREFAVRLALGASQVRIVRQLLTESVLLAGLGGLLGLLLAKWGTRAALGLLPQALPRASEIGLDGRMLGFTAVASFVVGIAFGLAPVFKTLTTHPADTLKSGARTSGGARMHAQRAFVVIEMATALVLLIGAGLMIRSLITLWNTDPGFEPHRVLSFAVTLPTSMRNAPPDAIRAAFRDIERKIDTVPGIESSSFTWGAVPLQGDDEKLFWIEGHPKPATDNEKNWALSYVVGPDYLKLMRIALQHGRFFAQQDDENSVRVAVVDEEFVHKFFPNEDPIGRRLNFSDTESALIVGVVRHVNQWGLDSDDTQPLRAQLYLSLMQLPQETVGQLPGGMGLLVRWTAGASPFETIRNFLSRSNSDVVVYGPQTMDETISASLAAKRFAMLLLSIFALLALLLSVVGIYGVLSNLVGQRTKEIGVRMALGAQRSQVLRLVLKDGAQFMLIGIAIGFGAALALTRLMSGLLFGVKPTDPLTFVAVSLFLCGAALLACYLPARRAMKVDPMVALRYE